MSRYREFRATGRLFFDCGVLFLIADDQGASIIAIDRGNVQKVTRFMREPANGTVLANLNTNDDWSASSDSIPFPPLHLLENGHNFLINPNFLRYPPQTLSTLFGPMGMPISRPRAHCLPRGLLAADSFQPVVSSLATSHFVAYRYAKVSEARYM